ncbi:MAG: hypothetical protein HBSAPP03_29380 [Phycisphaerae bacterium]|nr:MAG: hypothetical protein HBSAPP03_29380 [Phycisphaerae bacterium]
MSAIPSNLARVPNVLSTAISFGSINRTNVALLRIQQQITTGVEISRPSDDLIRASLISVLDARLDRGAQLQRNYTHADAALGVLDSVFQEAHSLALNAKSIASEQMGASSSAEERRSQANVVDQIIQSLYNVANRQSVAGYALAGTRVGSPAVAAHLGGYRYLGTEGGLVTDLDLASSIPLTFGGGNAIAGLSGRVRGTADLNPGLTLDTRLRDVDGGRGGGVALGPVRFSINGGPVAEVDFTQADTLQNVLDRLNAAIRDYEAANTVTALGPGGVSIAGGSITIDVASGVSIQFAEVGTATTARDLGLTADTPFAFTPTQSTGTDLNPRLTWRTPVAAMTGLGGPLGRISISNAGRTAEVDLSGAATLGDVRDLIEGTGLGVRVGIGADGRGIDVRSETAAGSAGALSIRDVVASGQTATRLGIRTMMPTTRIADFNFGRGVGIVDGQNDPQTNTPSVALNADIRVTLGDSGGTTIDIDLRPQDMATVQTVLDRMNAQIAAGLAGAGLPAGSLTAELDEGTNGLVLRQDALFPDALKVTSLNNSAAAEGLGLMGGSFDAGSARFIGVDRAGVRVNGLFSDLIDLREALRTNDVRGITLAGMALETSITSLAESRGMVGGYGQQIDMAKARETDRITADETTRSTLRDTDFTKAASRLALLQTQLQAGLQVAATAQRLSLLDFLG